MWQGALFSSEHRDCSASCLATWGRHRSTQDAFPGLGSHALGGESVSHAGNTSSNLVGVTEKHGIASQDAVLFWPVARSCQRVPRIYASDMVPIRLRRGPSWAVSPRRGSILCGRLGIIFPYEAGQKVAPACSGYSRRVGPWNVGSVPCSPISRVRQPVRHNS